MVAKVVKDIDWDGWLDNEDLRATVERTEEWWITESRINPLAFGQYVFGYVPNSHHVRWCKQFFNPENVNTIVIAPRGSAKTTWLMICLLWYMSHFPHSSNMILSVTALQAQKRLQFIAATIEHNERYQRVFPHIVPDNKKAWNKSELSIKDTRWRYSKWLFNLSRHGDGKSPTLYAAGVGGSGVVGSRVYGILALDDLLDSKTARTESIRDSIWDWLINTVIPILQGNNYRIWHVTTRWSDDDMAQRQIDSGEFTYSYTRALTRDHNGQLRSYWPTMFPVSKLAKILKQIGETAFQLMYMNVITGLNGEIFSADMLRNPVPKELPLYDEVIVSTDCAITDKESSDESVIATVGVWHNAEGYPCMDVLDMLCGRWKPATTTRKMEKAYRKAQQRFKTLPVLLLETVSAHKIFLTLIAQNGKIPMHMINDYTPSVNKGIRARPMAAMGEDQRIRFDIPDRSTYDNDEGYLAHWYHRTFSQLVQFTGKPDNPDDRVDVLTQIVQEYCGDVDARQTTKPTYEFKTMKELRAELMANKKTNGGQTVNALAPGWKRPGPTPFG
jgi:hypothetical protein